ncbi:MAG: hypothetical protein DLM63_09765 [Solirubrobacterales bacterium]|nr:MAG: hypothetical protein DLM63_09765 [Solirubrobacterales bacterium]
MIVAISGQALGADGTNYTSGGATPPPVRHHRRVALPFVASDAALLAVQASLVAAPGAGLPAGLRVPRGRWWALIPPASVAAVVFGLQLAPDGAHALTYLALGTTPPLAAIALGWAGRFARPGAAALALPLLALAWAARGSLTGDAAALVLSALGCVTLGRLLAAVAPLRWLKLGIFAMAAIDTALVIADQLQRPNAVLNAAAPGAGLPRLQVAQFGGAVMGYGDLFIAALLGGVLAAQRRERWWPVLCCLALAAAFDLLFFISDELPATVPVALTLIVIELVARRRAQAAGGRATARRAPLPRLARPS